MTTHTDHWNASGKAALDKQGRRALAAISKPEEDMSNEHEQHSSANIAQVAMQRLSEIQPSAQTDRSLVEAMNHLSKARQMIETELASRGDK